MVRTVNGFSLQGTSFEAERTLKELAAYTPPPPQTQNKKTEPVSQKDEAPPVKKRKIEKIDGKPVVVPEKPVKPDGGNRKAEPEETLESLDGYFSPMTKKRIAEFLSACSASICSTLCSGD